MQGRSFFGIFWEPKGGRQDSEPDSRTMKKREHSPRVGFQPEGGVIKRGGKGVLVGLFKKAHLPVTPGVTTSKKTQKRPAHGQNLIPKMGHFGRKAKKTPCKQRIWGGKLPYDAPTASAQGPIRGAKAPESIETNQRVQKAVEAQRS